MTTRSGTAPLLASWNDTSSRRSIVGFVERVTQEGKPEYVPPEERIAVFDNDGTLWCEKPMPVELGFILKRLAQMAEEDVSLRDRQPWEAARERDYAWLGGVIDKHYHGDDTDVRVLMGGIVQAFAGMSVGEYEAQADAFLRNEHHPTLGRRLTECTYLPMVELLRYLEANGFTTYIASGGDRDFMRPVTGEAYGIPAERVIGSSTGLRYQEDDGGGTIVYQA
ncbi:MAG: HAD family hydrolase, partial [Actinomycetota bacterium]